MNAEQQDRSLRYYTLYIMGISCYGWAPLFFLYISKHCTLTEVLELESIYYITVFLLEVPSGYFSDVFGRRKTLILSTLALALSYATFALGQSYTTFILAQILLAMGISFNSGTDTSLHLALLHDTNRANEYGPREAKLATRGLMTSAFAALSGGLLGIFDMRLAYLLSALGALLGFYAAFRIKEPEHTEHATSIRDNLTTCIKLIKQPQLRWLFAFASVAIVLNHIPYEFYQPYIRNLGTKIFNYNTDTYATLWTGIHLMGVQLTASWMASRSSALSQRFGAQKFLLATMLLQVLLIGIMGVFEHAFVVILLLARAWPGAFQKAPLRAHITPLLPRRVSATYLSMQSLTGRLAFGGTLLLLSLTPEVLALFTDNYVNTQKTNLPAILMTATGLSLCFFLFLVVFALKDRLEQSTEAT